jgi:hypothetical protein
MTRSVPRDGSSFNTLTCRMIVGGSSPILEIPEATIDAERSSHARVRHIAFAYEKLGDLLGTYVRLKKLSMTPQGEVNRELLPFRSQGFMDY